MAKKYIKGKITLNPGQPLSYNFVSSLTTRPLHLPILCNYRTKSPKNEKQIQFKNKGENQ